MLLYDQILSHCSLMRRRHGEGCFNEHQKWLVQALGESVIYELSDCVALRADWERERDHAIPKRPPTPFVWAEWRFREPDPLGLLEWTLGCLIQETSEANCLGALSNAKPLAGGVPLAERVGSGRLPYFVKMFRRIDRHLSPDGKPSHKEDWNVPAADYGFFIISMEPDGSGVRANKILPNVSDCRGPAHVEEVLRDHTLPGMALHSCEYENHLFQVGFPWPPFMAFALLHCKNVVTVEHNPDQHIQRQCRKRGEPGRCTYKTLAIEVPKTVHDRQGHGLGEDNNDARKVRFHLCSGHFRELRSERFTRKRGQWVWVPAHWRGDSTLGVVAKDYKLTSPGESTGA
jgi:hypothetical protein